MVAPAFELGRECRSIHGQGGEPFAKCLDCGLGDEMGLQGFERRWRCAWLPTDAAAGFDVPRLPNDLRSEAPDTAPAASLQVLSPTPHVVEERSPVDSIGHLRRRLGNPCHDRLHTGDRGGGLLHHLSPTIGSPNHCIAEDLGREWPQAPISAGHNAVDRGNRGADRVELFAGKPLEFIRSGALSVTLQPRLPLPTERLGKPFSPRERVGAKVHTNIGERLDGKDLMSLSEEADLVVVQRASWLLEGVDGKPPEVRSFVLESPGDRRTGARVATG